MAEKKRTPIQREYDLEQLASLYLKGKRQVDIAVELKVTQQQISYDLKEIHKRWRESGIVNLDEAKQKELSRIDELERTYWDAWENSLSERTRSRVEKTGVDAEGNPRGKSSIEREMLLGVPAYLTGVQWCISERCKLLGLYAPTKVAPTTPDGLDVLPILSVRPGEINKLR